MKKVLVCMMLIVSMLLCVGCGDDQDRNSQKNSNNKIAEAIGVKGIELVIGDIHHDSSGDTAEIVAKIPNYTQLFTTVCDADDFTGALLAEIEKGNFSTVEYTGEVTVTYDGEKPIYNTDPVVKGFIEEELIKAINTVMESENAS